MKWAVSQLLKSTNQPIQVDELVDFSDVVKQHSELRGLSKVIINGTGRFEDSKHIHFDLTIKGEMTLGCAQTLEDVILPFEIVTDEIFTLDPKEEGIDDYHKPYGQTIDLAPIVWNCIILEVPIRVVSDKAKKLPQSGSGWQVISEEDYLIKIAENETKDNIDPRLSKLLDLLEEDKK